MHPAKTLLATLTGAFLLGHQPAIANKENSLTAPWPSDSFYKGNPLFSSYAKENSSRPQFVYRFGPVGMGIELTLPAFGMKVRNIEEGSPAAATGKLKPGQIIESINGQALKDIDPRIQLGSILAKAEATDGKITLTIKDTPQAKAEAVLIQIPILGAYSKTWPLDCPKSDKIVRGVADWITANVNPLSALQYDQSLLFLLSTGEEQDLETARQWVAKAIESRTINGNEYLFIENGGFSENHPRGWSSPYNVLIRAK